MTQYFIRLLEGALSRFGLRVIPAWRLASLPQAAHLRQVFELLKIDCVLDVGANVGQYRNFLRNEVGYRGAIVSFEPVPENAAILRKNTLDDPMWTIHEYALGAEQGTAAFNVMSSSTFSSFLTPEHSQTDVFRDQNKVDHAITVQVKRLDDVLPEICRKFTLKQVYLKLDTQGFDLQVIEGGRSVLKDIAALQTEASVTPIYTGMPDYIETIRVMESLGFCISGIFPITPERVLRLIEFDCHMVNTRLVHQLESGSANTDTKQQYS